jgi:hypothetical protein
MSSRYHPGSLTLLSVFMVNCGATACPAYLFSASRLARYPRLSLLKPTRPADGLPNWSVITSSGPLTQGILSARLGRCPRVASATSTVPAS